MRAFYDEVERIGNKVGTVRSGNGHYTVANTSAVISEQRAHDTHNTNISHYQKLPDAPAQFYYSSVIANDTYVQKGDKADNY